MKINKTYIIAFLIILLDVSYLVYHRYHVDLDSLEGPHIYKYSKYGRLISEIRYKNGVENFRNEYQVSKGKIIWVEYRDGELKGIIDCDKYGNHLSSIDKDVIFKYEYFD